VQHLEISTSSIELPLAIINQNIIIMSDKKKLENLKKDQVDANNIKGGRAIRQHNQLNSSAEPTRAPGSRSNTLSQGVGQEAEEMLENRIRPSETK